MKTSRRQLLAMCPAALAATALPTAALAAITHDDRELGFKIGVASYSLRKLSRADAIKALQTLRVKYVNIKEFHLPLVATEAEIAQARKEFNEAGIQILGVGNVSFQKNDDDDIKRKFQYAKALGAPLIVMAPTSETLPKIEAMVKEFDIKAAIHNHGPEDKHFPSPYDVLKAVKGMDPRVGLCMDVGHSARTGVDVVKAVRDAGARLLDMHTKDLSDMSNIKSQVRVGEGQMPIVGIFKELKAINYHGGVMLEYEIDENNPVPGMQESLAYERGVADALRG